MSTRGKKNVTEIAFNELSRQQAIVIAYEAAAALKWSTTYVSSAGLITYTDNSMFEWNGQITINLDDEAIVVKSESTDNRLFDGGRNKEAIQQFVAEFERLRENLTAEVIAEKYLEMEKDFPAPEDDVLRRPPLTTKEKFVEFFSIFKPAVGYTITPIILDLIILIFIVMALSGVSVFAPHNESLLKWGANFRPMTLAGEWWRLITNCFIHIGIFHLLMNAYALLVIGAQLEAMLGKSRFLAAYLCTGIIASITSLWWHDLTISAGASGAIFGLYGVFLAMLTTNLIEKTVRKRLLSSILVFVVYNLMYGMKGGIDNAAHLGGLLSGVLVGYIYFPGLTKPDAPKLKWMSIGAAGMIALCLSAYAVRSIPNDIGTYDKKMEAFSANERAALSVIEMPKGTSDEKIMSELIQTGIPKWKANLQILQEIEALNLPDLAKQRDQLLKTYTELRLASYELMYKAVSENTTRYQPQITAYFEQVDSVLKEINKG